MRSPRTLRGALVIGVITLFLAVIAIATTDPPTARATVPHLDPRTRAHALTFTDDRAGLAPLPPTATEQVKLDAARAACDAAEAAGTRWIAPSPDRATTADATTAQRKLERLRHQPPQPRAQHPGIPANAQGGG